MSLTSQIDRVYTLVAQKINDLRNRLDMLEHADTIKDHLVSIESELDKLGCCTPKYCLPDLCSGELPEFPVPSIEGLAPREFPEIPDIPLPTKAPPPVFPSKALELTASVVVEALYCEWADLALLPLSYQNIHMDYGHVCNRAKFAVYANDVYIGDINLNNDGVGYPSPYDNEENTPSALTGGTWEGSPYARYSRIDITRQQAIEIVRNTDSTVLRFRLVAFIDDPHNNITWLRISRNTGVALQTVQDVLAVLNTDYSVDVAG